MIKKALKILIIDESPKYCAVFRQYLLLNEEFEFDCIEAEVNTNAIETCLAQKPDCVLFNYKPHDSESFRFIEQLNPNPLNPDFPIVLLVQKDGEESVHRALKKGAQDFLSKDHISGAEILRAIINAVEKVELLREIYKKGEISEHYQTHSDSSLQFSEARYNLAVKGAGIGWFEWNIKTGEINWSEELEAAAGIPANSFDNAFDNFIKLVHPLDREILNQRIEAAFNDGEYECEFRMLRGDGTIRWLIGKGRVFFDAAGNPARLVGVDIDITKRKESEEELRKSQLLTQNIIETAPSVFYTFNLKSQTNTFLTTQAEAALGYTSDELKNSATNFLPAFMHPDDLRAAKKHFHSIAKSHNSEVFEFEYRLRHKSGEWRWFRSRDRVFRRDLKGKPLEILGIAQDITERKETEERLRRNHETFFNLIKNTPFGIYIVDGDFRLVEISAGSQKVFSGIKPLIGRDFAEILRTVWEEPFATEAIAIFRQTLETGEPYRASNTTEQRGNIANVESYDWKIERIILPDGRFGVVCYFYDLTEQKEIQEKLRQSEENLRRILAQSNAGIVLADATGRMKLVNRRWCEMLGYAEEEMLTMSVLDLTHQSSIEATINAVSELSAGGADFVIEKNYQRKDGSIMPGASTVSAVRGANGEYLGLVAVVIDLTERKKADEQIRLSEERFRLASDAAAALVYDIDLTQTRSIIAHGLERVTGYKNEESDLSKDWWHSLIHPEDLPGHLENYEKHLIKGGTYKADYRIRRKDGSWIWVEDTAQIIKNEAGDPVGLVGAIVDITERKEAEDASRRSELLFRMASEAVGAWVYDVDLTGSRPAIVNGLERVTGYSEKESPLTSDWWHSLIHPEDLPGHLENFEEQIKRGKSYHTIHRVRHQNGEWIWVEDTGQIFRNESGAAVRLIGTIVDITSRKAAEDALRYQLQLTQNISDTAAVAIFVSDRDGRVAFLNPEAEKIFGFSLEEIKGKNLHDTIHYKHPDGTPFPQSECPLGRVYQEGIAVRDYEGTFFCKDGSTVEIICSNTPIIENGEVTSEVMAMLDITERKKAEAEIKTLSDYTREVLESITDPLFTLDRDYRFTYMSSRGEKLIRREPGELLGKVMWDEFIGIAGTPFEKMYRDAMEKNIVSTVTDYYPDHDRWYEVTTYPSPNGITVYFKNVTGRKRNEDNLAFLADLQGTFAPLLSSEEIMRTAGGRIIEFLNLDHCAFVEIDETAETATIICDERSANSQELVGVYRLENFHSVRERESLTAGNALVINNVRNETYSSEAAQGFEALGISALVTTPFISNTGWKFALSAQNSAPRLWRDDEIELLEELTTRIYTRLERARAEEALRVSERFNRTILESSPDCFKILDGKGRLQYFNPNGLCLMEIDDFSLVKNQLWWDLWTEEARDKVRSAFKKAQLGEIVHFQEFCPTAKGTPKWWDVIVAPVGGDHENGIPSRIISVSRDITETKRAEIAVRESEEKFRSLFNSIDEGFVIIEIIFDDDGKPLDYRFVEANPAFTRLTGLPADALGKTARDVIPELEEFWFETYGRVALTGIPARFENEAAALNRWFEVYASRIGDELSRRVAVVFNNITDRKESETERERLLKLEQKARREAEEANRAKDEFLAMLSHELRSPLNSMYGWTQMLLNNELDAEKTQKAVEVIARSVRLQNALIEDLLDVSRIISGKMRLEKDTVSLVSIVQAAIEGARPAAEKQGVTISSALLIEEDEIDGDRHRLSQIVGNLLTNAVKFTPAGGEISIDLRSEGESAVLTVNDNGIGIEQDVLPIIFDRFKQADTSSKRKFGGLGLGLAIVKHLVELHGGTITAHSGGKGKGSSFAVSLPLVSQNSVKADFLAAKDNIENGSQQNQTLNGLRVLLVDDDFDSLNLIGFVIESNGAQTVSVSSVTEALRELSETKFDLLISDIGMADMDGYDLIQKVRENETAAGAIQKLPAIAVTGYVSAEDRERVRTAGFQKHLSKPIDTAALPGVILNLLNNNAI